MRNKLLFWACLVLIVFTAVYYYSAAKRFKKIRMPVFNMEPAILRGSEVIIDKLFYTKHKPVRGDIIIFKIPSEPETIRLSRIVALDGERVEIKRGMVLIDDKELNDPEIFKQVRYENTETKYGREGEQIIVPERSYYVLGDNSPQSYDSRYFGFVPEESIVGKVVKVRFSAAEKKKLDFRQRKQEQEFAELKEKQKKAEEYEKIAEDFEKEDRHEEALEYYRKIMELDDVSSIQVIGRAGIMNILKEQERWDEYLDELEKNILWENTLENFYRDKKTEIKRYLYMADIYAEHKDDYNNALKNYQKALDLAEDEEVREEIIQKINKALEILTPVKE